MSDFIVKYAGNSGLKSGIVPRCIRHCNYLNDNFVTCCNVDSYGAVFAIRKPCHSVGAHVSKNYIVLNALDSGTGKSERTVVVSSPLVVVTLAVACGNIYLDVVGTEENLGVAHRS